MHTMFTVFYDNVDILNDSQKIHLLFQKVQNPILTQIKSSPQLPYDMYQSNTVTYEYISNNLAAETASLGYHTPQGFVDVNTCAYKAPERGVRGEGGAIFTWFTPIGPSYRMERNNIYFTRVSDSPSRADGITSPSTRKIDQGCICQVQKIKRLKDPTQDLIFESQV